MKEIIIKMSEITDSREVMESKPYPMTVYFIYILPSILLIFLIWIYFSEIDIVLKGNGILRPESGVSIINNKVTGRVMETNVREGLEVGQGDILFIIQHDDLMATKELLTVEISKEEIELINLTKYKDSVILRKNLFEEDSEKEYFFKYFAYSESLSGVEENINFNKNLLIVLEEKYEGINKLKKSIDGEKSAFVGLEGIYIYRFKEYELKKEELCRNLENLRIEQEKTELLYENGIISEIEYQISDDDYRQSKLLYNQYINASRLQVENEYDEIKQQIQRLESEIKILFPDVYLGKESRLPIETKEIIETDNKIIDTKKNLRSLKENLIRMELEIEKCIIKAEACGVISVKRTIVVGDYIAAGENIATIIDSNEKVYKVQILMPEREISTIHIGDIVKYHFTALPYREYGELDGEVIRISEDSIINKEQGTNGFIVEADVKSKELYSYKGNKGNLKVGMSCEAQIITKRKKVLYFLLEKMNLWN